jgi:hypothetical protein
MNFENNDDACPEKGSDGASQRLEQRENITGE